MEMASSDSDSEEEFFFLGALALDLARQGQRRREKVKRRWWVRPWIANRQQFGAYHALMVEMERGDDVGAYTNFLRMDRQQFQQLLALISPLIEKESTLMRESIPAGERLAVTLRFLATGDSYQSLCYLYRIGRQTLGKIIPSTCAAIHTVLQRDYLKIPQTQEEWATIARNFAVKWQFPNCIGAMDGKHIALKAPPKSGSEFYNYKHFHSIILLAVIDAHYRFIMYDVGANGRNNDSGVFARSKIAEILETSARNIPAPRPLPERDTRVPYVVVGDEAFPLKPYLMKPYPARGLTGEQRVFNYRLSRARRISENAFGIMVNRFGVLSRAMNLHPDTATTVTQACIALHNFLRTEKDARYAQEPQQDGQRQWFRDLGQQAGNRNAGSAREVREEFCDYFYTNGAVNWQWDRCT